MKVHVGERVERKLWLERFIGHCVCVRGEVDVGHGSRRRGPQGGRGHDALCNTVPTLWVLRSRYSSEACWFDLRRRHPVSKKRSWHTVRSASALLGSSGTEHGAQGQPARHPFHIYIFNCDLLQHWCFGDRESPDRCAIQGQNSVLPVHSLRPALSSFSDFRSSGSGFEARRHLLRRLSWPRSSEYYTN